MNMRRYAYFGKNFSVEQIRFIAQIFHMPEIDCTEILKALADRTRLRIIKALLAQECSGVNELTEQLDITQYNTSKHLRVLKEGTLLIVLPEPPEGGLKFDPVPPGRRFVPEPRPQT